MKTFKELREALTTQQRIKRSISSKKVAKKAAIKRARSMKKPPSQEKVMKAVKRAVRQKALAIVDKAGVYKTASVGVKMGIEKKADIKVIPWVHGEIEKILKLYLGKKLNKKVAAK